MCHFYDKECVISKTWNASCLWTVDELFLWQKMLHFYDSQYLWQVMRHPYDKGIAISMEIIYNFYDISENMSSLWEGMRHLYDMECVISMNSGCVVSMTGNAPILSADNTSSLWSESVSTISTEMRHIDLEERSWFPELVSFWWHNSSTDISAVILK